MNKNTILVIDDEKDFLEIIRTNLENHGFKVIATQNPVEGLKIAEKKKPDLIILDVIIPEINGFQCCKEIRQNPQLKNTPIIMLSCKNQDEDIQWGLNSGANEYLIKPFNAEDLIDIIHSYLKAKAAA
ncbi:MAG: response regulator [Deltaproteobacteria bacterium]|nr:response regulator [Deltaproteobacteria bacterium]